MKVFISWSGDKSQSVAVALHRWLPTVIHRVKPFVSAADISAGARWQTEIASELDRTNFGIVCVTRENQTSAWLNFEAGALAKVVGSSQLIPLAIDLKPSDIKLPLAQFQAQALCKKGLKAVVKSLNAALDEDALPDELLHNSFDKWWPDLEVQLETIEQETTEQETTAAPHPVRTERELLEETLNTVRSLSRTVNSTQRTLQPERLERIDPHRAQDAVEYVRRALRGDGFPPPSVTVGPGNLVQVITPTPIPRGRVEEISDYLMLRLGLGSAFLVEPPRPDADDLQERESEGN